MRPLRPHARRWPLHPQLGVLESLSSWLQRIAQLYGLSVTDLVRHNLGEASAQLADTAEEALDWDPPIAVLAALAERTGAELGQLRRMTMAGWVPWLTDTLAPDDGQDLFDTYVRQDSVLLAPGEAGLNHAGRWRSWKGPWLPAQPMRRTCPLCAAAPERGTALTWRLPLMVSCVEHGCRLEPVFEVAFAASQGNPMAPVPVNGHLAALDRRTQQGLAAGAVALPGRSVHVGVWFRLLRTLLDEVSMAPSRVGARSRATLEHVWQATGRPVRAGLTVWRPYEQLDWPLQEAMLHAAAVALRLAADRRITPRGTLGPAIAEPPHERVYDGDDPRRRPMAASDFATAINAWLDTARADPETARHMLRMLTAFDPSPANVAKQRHFLISQAGVPPEFLRLDLLPPRPHAAE